MREAWRLLLFASSSGLFLGLVLGLISYRAQRVAEQSDDSEQRSHLRDYLPAPVFMGMFPAVLATCLYLLIGGHDRQVFTSPLDAWRYSVAPMGVAVAVTVCLGSLLSPNTYVWIEHSYLRRWFRGVPPRSPKRYGIYFLIGSLIGILCGTVSGAFAAVWHSQLPIWTASLAGTQWLMLSSAVRYQSQESEGEES